MYIYGLAPQYLSSFLTVREYSRYNLLIKWQVCLSQSFYQDKENTGRQTIFNRCTESMEQPSITYQEWLKEL